MMNEHKSLTIVSDAFMILNDKKQLLIKDAALVPDRIENDNDLDTAAAVITRISKAIKEIERLRKEITGPLDAAKKDIMRQEKDFTAELQAQLDRIKAESSRYSTEKLREAEAERRKAMEEAAAAEAQRQREAEAGIFDDDDDIQTEQETIIIPEATATKTSYGKTVTVWTWEIVDANAVPDEYKTIDPKLINAGRDYQVKMGREPKIPGVKFTKTVQVRSR